MCILCTISYLHAWGRSERCFLKKPTDYLESKMGRKNICPREEKRSQDVQHHRSYEGRRVEGVDEVFWLYSKEAETIPEKVVCKGDPCTHASKQASQPL
jgi:hypothetical protein